MLTDEQLKLYLERIGLDHAPAPTKDGLDLLVRAHQTHIPFETVGIHLGNGTIDLSIDGMFEKVMVENKGGYCFELNKLFEELLSTLGFEVRPVLSRAVLGRDGRMPINHRGILVNLDEGEAFVDVGFGGPMPSGALMLDSGRTQEIFGETFIAEQIDGSWWRVDRVLRPAASTCDGDASPARQTELEFCTAIVEDIDFEPLSVYCCQPGTVFRDIILVNMKTKNGYKGIRDRTLTINENGKKTIVEMKTDEERSRALEEHFGLKY